MSAQPKYKHTLEEYLEIDRQSEARLEYWEGEIFDMSGVNIEHAQVEISLAKHLGSRLHQRGCHIFPANMRIKVPSFPPYRYGDTSALCGTPQTEKIGGVDTLTNPALIIEVLSESTEGYDRGDKFSHYKSIPSFCEYLLIAQYRPHVTHYIKLDDRTWNQREYSDFNDTVKLVSVTCAILVREIYEHVTFKEPQSQSHLRPLA